MLQIASTMTFRLATLLALTGFLSLTANQLSTVGLGFGEPILAQQGCENPMTTGITGTDCQTGEPDSDSDGIPDRYDYCPNDSSNECITEAFCLHSFWPTFGVQTCSWWQSSGSSYEECSQLLHPTPPGPMPIEQSGAQRERSLLQCLYDQCNRECWTFTLYVATWEFACDDPVCE